jgi:outer membrane protein TolC
VPPDVVEVGVPADLLRQRPDIRGAERRLAAQTARIGVAQAELYPQFFLPGTLALEAFDVGNLNGSSLAYAFGPTLRWNLFSGGRIRNTIRAEEARTRQFLHAYEQTVLLALEDTEGAMVAFAQERDRGGSVLAARDAASKSVELVKDLYRSGLTQFQNVLDMERSLAQQDDELAVSRGALAADAVRIYRALGGGWDPEDPEPWAAVEATRTPSWD